MHSCHLLTIFALSLWFFPTVTLALVTTHQLDKCEGDVMNLSCNLRASLIIEEAIFHSVPTNKNGNMECSFFTFPNVTEDGSPISVVYSICNKTDVTKYIDEICKEGPHCTFEVSQLFIPPQLLNTSCLESDFKNFSLNFVPFQSYNKLTVKFKCDNDTIITKPVANKVSEDHVDLVTVLVNTTAAILIIIMVIQIQF